MKVTELRELEKQDLLEKLNRFQNDLLDLRIQEYQGRMTTSSSIRKMRKDIARVKTLLKEKELGINGGV